MDGDAPKTNGKQPGRQPGKQPGKPVAASRQRPWNPPGPPVVPGDNDLYFNRELSLLQFQWRVLGLAQDSEVPLLERLRFLAISTSNLDEFFEIRVAGLKQQIEYDVGISRLDRLTPQEAFQHVATSAHDLVNAQYRVLNEELLPLLEQEGVRVLKRENWKRKQSDWVQDYFRNEVLPVMTPVGLDPAHPFPRIVNKSLNFIVSLKGKDAFGRSSRGAVVQAPRLLPRLIQLPASVAEKPHDFVLLSSVIHAHVGELFPGMKIRGCYQFRVTRNSDLWVDEEEVEDLLKALTGELQSRRFGDAVRLEVDENCPEETQGFLLQQFRMTAPDLYAVNGPVNLHRLTYLYELVDRPDLKYQSFLPGLPPAITAGATLFDVLRDRDVLLHHPFQSFAPVVELLRQAARDPKVLAIKQTLYRTGVSSPLINALLDAAKAGKEVTVVIELRARFDEEANINLATRLQQAGARVVYGIVGYKAHAKMLLIVRQEGKAVRRYVHLGTGNYHIGTSKGYTDLGLLSARDSIGMDVHDLFQQLTGLGKVSGLKELLQSPFTLHETILELIQNETAAANAGRKAYIIAKMNSLIDGEVIQALYAASQAGVRIDLIVRGICCLRPGVPGLSENIHVRSTLGRFLEHTRVFLFHADGSERLFCSSADWMPRNFFRRVEACFPILDKKLKKRVISEALQPYLQDNVSSWMLNADGSYRRITFDDAAPYNAQATLLAKLADDPGLPPEA